MNRLFGGKKEEPKPQVLPPPVKKVETPPADLTATSKKLEVRVQEINCNVATLDEELKALYAKMKAAKGTQQTYYKQRVINLLKKRKMLQGQVDALLGQQMTIDRVTFTNETIQNTIETTKALKQAVEIQKVTMKELDIDALADLKDEMADMAFESQQMTDLLGRNYDCDADEDDLDAELKELDDEIYFEQLQKPNANQSKIPSMANSQQSAQSDPYSDLLSKVNNS